MRSGLRSIEIPSSVEVIGEMCFRDCDSLIDVKFEAGSLLGEIRQYAFQYCGFNVIKIPKNVKVIMSHSFENCKSLRKVIFEGEVRMEKRVFMGCSIDAVVLPLGLPMFFSLEGFSLEPATVGANSVYRRNKPGGLSL
jgi:hypothetical protein